MPTLTAQPTFICMMGTPATTSKATATTASARLMSSNASPCGDQVNQQLLISWTVCVVFTFIFNILHFILMILFRFFSLFVCRSQACPWDLLRASQLCRGSLWELWEGLQRLLCQMRCEVRLCSCTDAVEVQRNCCAKRN